MKAAFYTLGCKVNQYETQAMREILKSNGYEIVSHDEKADIYIVNSCTVTAASNQKTRQAVRNFKRQNPQGVVLLCGCMSQAFPEQSQAINEADIIIGNTDHKQIAVLLEKYFTEKKRIIEITPHLRGEKFESTSITDFEERTRAIIKIEDGCDRFCSYCEIPFARGHVRSKPIDDLKNEAKRLADKGYKEIVLVGINLSAYKTENGEDLGDAVIAVNAIEKIKRVRLGSLEPDHMSEEMLSKFKQCEKFCPQFHLSLQSGCDKTLKNMNRHYDCDFYEDLCTRLRESFDDASITTDVMVGFPGENEEDFNESLEFCKKIKFEKMHIFPYSVREGTRAAKMENQVEKSVKTVRAKTLANTAGEIRREYLKSQIGKTVSVLFERKRNDGYYEGYTKNYTPIKAPSLSEIDGEIRDVKITHSDDDFCYAKVIE